MVALQDDARGVSARGTAQVSVLVRDADGAALRHLRRRLDVSQVEAFAVDQTAGAQRTDWREGGGRF